MVLRRLVLFGSCVVLALSGCGSGGSKAISTTKVIDTFRVQTGHHLVRSSKESTPDWDDLEFDDPDPNYEWGTFSVDVVKPGGSGDVLTEHDDDPTDPHSKPSKIKPDDDGIYWDQIEPTGDWTATKRYGPNVYLVWIGGSTKGSGLGAPFDRVDTALSALASS